MFYGECNQVCGTNHSRMPIVIRAVPEQEFNAWLVTAKTKFSDASPAVPVHTADAAPKLLTVAENRR